ncbi:hypothetical protein AJ88_27640 [Mesorhizobium amorphae CCBAU 01583]|nr:hypothetical protein AJ88_27640 [Mesorhizobium amorphae CCBAU 01583]
MLPRFMKPATLSQLCSSDGQSTSSPSLPTSIEMASRAAAISRSTSAWSARIRPRPWSSRSPDLQHSAAVFLARMYRHQAYRTFRRWKARPHS